MTNIFKPKDLSFTGKGSPIPEFAWHSSPDLAALSGASRLQFDIRSLDPGKFSYPYHFHRNSEELFVILSGRATLRTVEGFVEVTENDVVFFEMGPKGAHQLYNHTDKACVFLDIRTIVDIDVCEYPDSKKINILPDQEVYRAEDRVDYYLAEERVKDKWPPEILRSQHHKG